MHTKIVLLLTITMFWSCSRQQAAKTSTPQKLDPIKIEVNFNPDKSAEFVITNQSNSLIKIFEHYKLAIEKQDGDNWIPLRILHCPCGAPCARPAEFIVLQQGENLNKKWNLDESWCGDTTNTSIPETITKPAQPGIYRIGVLYGISNREINTFYNEFTLKQ
ncbi:hypothetical protein [Perlabentimonas gracilis]|uniref:hypothetical protein n=1 Tax=Perlabentimonas gracilis TaxID=2715279 RepID=UPI0014072538|nr:hypothetical protein [Perlabentimonas gracilis]NHB67136.1 hypothetical protein [Perlabentimonas gracilis]